MRFSALDFSPAGGRSARDKNIGKKFPFVIPYKDNKRSGAGIRKSRRREESFSVLEQGRKKSRKRRVITALVSAAVLLLAGCTAAGYGLAKTVFNNIFLRAVKPVEVPEFYKNSPHKAVSEKGMQFMEPLACEDKYIESFDGTRLHACLFPCDGGGKKFVLGIHGYRSAPRPEYGPYAEFYLSEGYSMLLTDDRAHGGSGGDYVGFGVLDRLDCIEWAKYLVDEYGEDVEIILHGVSMGAATVLAASGEESLPSQVKGVVADCGYTRAWDLLIHQLKAMANLPSKLILPAVERMCVREIGYNLHDNSPIDLVANADMPLLIVHGSKDPLVPVSMAQELFDACGSEKKKLLIIEGAGHAESIALAPEEYYKAIRDTVF